MTIQETINHDLHLAIKNKDIYKRDNLKVIIGEFQRQNKKDLSDDQTISIIKKLIKYETDLLITQCKPTSNYLELLQSYLPKQLSDIEILQWIKNNINFKQLKNKMQAISIVMKHFGTLVDGNQVKNIIQNYNENEEINIDNNEQYYFIVSELESKGLLYLKGKKEDDKIHFKISDNLTYIPPDNALYFTEDEFNKAKEKSLDMIKRLKLLYKQKIEQLDLIKDDIENDIVNHDYNKVYNIT